MHDEGSFEAMTTRRSFGLVDFGRFVEGLCYDESLRNVLGVDRE